MRDRTFSSALLELSEAMGGIRPGFDYAVNNLASNASNLSDWLGVWRKNDPGYIEWEGRRMKLGKWIKNHAGFLWTTHSRLVYGLDAGYDFAHDFLYNVSDEYGEDWECSSGDFHESYVADFATWLVKTIVEWNDESSTSFEFYSGSDISSIVYNESEGAPHSCMSDEDGGKIAVEFYDNEPVRGLVIRRAGSFAGRALVWKGKLLEQKSTANEWSVVDDDATFLDRVYPSDRSWVGTAARQYATLHGWYYREHDSAPHGKIMNPLGNTIARWAFLVTGMRNRNDSYPYMDSLYCAAPEKVDGKWDNITLCTTPAYFESIGVPFAKIRTEAMNDVFEHQCSGCDGFGGQSIRMWGAGGTVVMGHGCTECLDVRAISYRGVDRVTGERTTAIAWMKDCVSDGGSYYPLVTIDPNDWCVVGDGAKKGKALPKSACALDWKNRWIPRESVQYMHGRVFCSGSAEVPDEVGETAPVVIDDEPVTVESLVFSVMGEPEATAEEARSEVDATSATGPTITLNI